MASSAHIIAITDGQGQILEPLWLERAAAVHRQLRPMLPEAYAEKNAKGVCWRGKNGGGGTK